MPIFLIALGGALGALARYGIGQYIANHLSSGRLHFATLAVNLLGCFLIGLLYRLSQSSDLLHINLRPLVFVGLLGGFTTFSTFGLEMLNLLRDHGPAPAVTYILASVLGGLALTYLGYILANSFAPPIAG